MKLLWDGLDKVKPHESVGKDLWKDVGPADLGEMAADLEMQKAFFGKKRTYSDLSATGQLTAFVSGLLCQRFLFRFYLQCT